MSKKKNKNKHNKKKSKIIEAMEQTQKDLEEAQMPSPEQIEHIAQLAKDKEAANLKNEPWVAIVDLDVDYDNLNSGNFELDWNDLFIARLIKAGYQGKQDHDLVDQWFNNVCRHVVLETFEQTQTDLTQRGSVASDLKDGRREYK